jgi:hypothetical protein
VRSVFWAASSTTEVGHEKRKEAQEEDRRCPFALRAFSCFLWPLIGTSNAKISALSAALRCQDVSPPSSEVRRGFWAASSRTEDGHEKHEEAQEEDRRCPFALRAFSCFLWPLIGVSNAKISALSAALRCQDFSPPSSGARSGSRATLLNDSLAAFRVVVMSQRRNSTAVPVISSQRICS